jgi:group I intron endonuclease
MPYSTKLAGIYKIVHVRSGKCYVGQSQNLHKRLREHFRLLRWQKHPNIKLQRTYNRDGADSFVASIEVICENVSDLDVIEEAFLNGEAFFDERVAYNIADFSKAPMRNKTHSDEVRKRISEGRRATVFDYAEPEFRKRLSDAQLRRYFSDANYRAKIKFLVENDHLSYAERGRQVGCCTSSARKLALKYVHLKGML